MVSRCASVANNTRHRRFIRFAVGQLARERSGGAIITGGARASALAHAIKVTKTSELPALELNCSPFDTAARNSFKWRSVSNATP
jgi:hypothetical protein